VPGHRPPKARSEPTRESFHLGIAKQQYVIGALELDEFEAAVEHVLSGGTLTMGGRIPDSRRHFTVREIKHANAD
jgi:hypothetical protein